MGYELLFDRRSGTWLTIWSFIPEKAHLFMPFDVGQFIS